MTSFRLMSSGWGAEIDSAAALQSRPVRVICPFIKHATANRLFTGRRSEGMQILTRFDLRAFNEGVSDVTAFRLLLDAGAAIRGVRGLHSKLYLFGGERVIVTSANLTEAAMLRNHEFGFVSDDPAIVAECNGYFEAIWERAGGDLTSPDLDQWEEILEVQRRTMSERSGVSLPDFGIAAALSSPFTPETESMEGSGQAFLKFFGTGDNRSDPSEAVSDILESSGCHWACTYPANKRPRQVDDGDTMFLGRLCSNRDLLIFGRAIARKHRPGVDEATAEDIAQKGRGWKADWPVYVRVHSGRFVNGRLADGVSLRQMMDELGSDTFMSTQRNAASGRGNTVPSRAMMQKAHMQLSADAGSWLAERLELALRRFGEVDLRDRRYDFPAEAAKGL